MKAVFIWARPNLRELRLGRAIHCKSSSRLVKKDERDCGLSVAIPRAENNKFQFSIVTFSIHIRLI